MTQTQKPPGFSGRFTVVQIPWTPSGSRTHSFEVAPSDVIQLSMREIEAQPIKLKAASVGRRRDIALVDSLTSSYANLGTQFAKLNTEMNVGLIRGLEVNQTRDASRLKGLGLLQTQNIKPFHIPDDLPLFNLSKAERPRSRDIYRAPILIVKETLSAGARPLVAVADRDLVFTNAYFGARLPAAARQSAHLLATILSSSFAAWFFLMAGSEFGIWKRRLLQNDIALLPVPELAPACDSDAGKRLLKIERTLQRRTATLEDFTALDEAVFELYDLDEADRVVIRDGLFRASWQWRAGREFSVGQANVHEEVCRYTEVFLGVMDGWLSARNERHMRAEIFDLPSRSPLRVVRFVLEKRRGDANIEFLPVFEELGGVLARIGERMKVKIATALSAERELRVHGRDEVVIIKPAARRYWMGISALEDADAVVAESIKGARA